MITDPLRDLPTLEDIEDAAARLTGVTVHTPLLRNEALDAIIGGAGSEIERALAERGIKVPLLRLGLPDRFIDHGEQGQLLAELGLDRVGIVRAVRARNETRQQ